MLHLNKKLILLFLAGCTPYAFAAEMPEVKQNVVEDEENKANSIKVENYTLKHSKKKVNNDVDDFEDIEEEVQDEVESISKKLDGNTFIACMILSNSPAAVIKKNQNPLKKTPNVQHEGGHATYKRYVIGNYKNTGIIAKQGHKLAHKLGYHIIQTTPSHIGLSVCQLLAYNKQVNKLFHITTNKAICTKCHYILTKIIGYNKKIEHKEDGCNNQELPWPIPEAAENYINAYIIKSKRPLQITESILKELASKDDVINKLKKETEDLKEALKKQEQKTAKELEDFKIILDLKIEDCKKELADKDDVINKLEKDKEDLKEALKKQEQKTAKELEDCKIILDLKIENYKKELADKDDVINNLEKDKEDLKEALKKQEQKTAKELEDYKIILDLKIEDCKKELAVKDDVINNLEKDKEDLEMEIATKDEGCNILKKEKEDLKEALKKQEQKTAKELEDCKKDLADKDDVINNLEKDKEDLKEALKKQEQKTAKELEDFKKELAAKDDVINKLKKDKEDLELEIATKDESSNILKKEKEDLQKVSKELEDYKIILDLKIEDCKKELAAKDDVINNLEKDKEDLEMEMATKDEDCNILKKEKKGLELELAAKDDAINNLEKDKEDLEMEIATKDEGSNILKKEKADVEKALQESRDLVQTILAQKKEVEQKVEEMKYEAEEKEEKIFSFEAPKKLADNEVLFQQKLKENKCEGGNWYKENIPKDLAGIRKAYPLMQEEGHKQAALRISHGLAVLPDYVGDDFYVKVQYWSCKLYDLQKKVTPPAAKQLVCSFKKYLEDEANTYCPYHGKKVSPLPAPTSTLENPNWKARLAYAQKGWTHHDAKDKAEFVVRFLGSGSKWYKQWIQEEMEGLQQAYPKLQAQQHKKEALDLFIALSEIHRFEHFAFLFEYMKVQNRLLELTGTVGHITKNVIVYTHSNFVYCFCWKHS